MTEQEKNNLEEQIGDFGGEGSLGKLRHVPGQQDNLSEDERKVAIKFVRDKQGSGPLFIAARLP